MDEQRQQAYSQLIESLLKCPDGEEAEILAANTELLDAGFLQMLAVAAQHYSQQGQENTANWLRNLETQLSAALNLPTTSPAGGETSTVTPENIKVYEQFLQEVLLATAESEGDPQVIYPLLAANTDKLDHVFAELLRLWATKILAEAEVELEKAQFFAFVIGEFSNLINEFPLGNKADNIEIAITGNEIALTFFTRNISPEIWASVQNNLGTAYSDRIRGDKAENLEKAITAFSAALEVRNQTDFPVDWAMTQNNLGTAYSDRIRGDKAENLEKAITAFSAALEVRNQTDFPVDWAMTQNNLGTAYSDRIRGDKAENLEKAIAAFSSALEVYTPTNVPVTWASVQNNLGAAYSNRIRGDQADNLEYAIAAYTAVLEVINRNDFPVDWAATQNNLGNAYLKRIRGDQADNLEYAIAAYTAALKVRTRNDFPVDWATTQNNLATAYLKRIRGDQADNLEYAIAAYTAALEVRTRSNFPQKNAETLLNLGIAYQESQQFDLAYSTFNDAIITVEDLRGEIISGEESKRKQAEEWNKLFRRMVEVCLALGRDTEAIEYIERSKTRNLVELLTKATSTSQANLPLISSSIRFPEIQNLLDKNTAIIKWYIFNDCFRAFIITHDCEKPVIWHSDQQDLENLVNWTVDYLKLYSEDKKRWQFKLSDKLTQLTQRFHLDKIISLVPSSCQKLVLIPHRYLHLFPLHAIPLSTSNTSTPEYLIDRFPDGVSYAPSCQLLRFAQLKAQQLASSQLNQLSNLFAIQNPTNDLDFTDIEVETIATNFQPHQILKHSQASKAVLAEPSTNENLCKSQWIHFSCHGYFNFQFPLQSGLQLADAVIYDIPANTYSSRNIQIDENTAIDLDKCLTLEDIFLLNLPKCRLVTLSACETGFIDFTNNSDEYIGLASGFIKAGAANIITSLWAVSDFHTALLMIRFYETLSQDLHNVSLALNKTQQWLRQATQAQIITWIQGIDKIESSHKHQIIDLLKQYKPEQKPFKRPEYWAAFCAISPC